MENQKNYRFETRMTEKNLWHFALYHANRGYLGIFNAIFTLAAVYLLITNWNQANTAYRILFVVCVLLFTVWQPLQLRLKAKKQASLKVMQVPITMTFTEEGLTVEQGGQEQNLTWAQIGRVEGTRGMLVFYMDRIHAFLLPADAMGDSKEAFCDFLREMLPKKKRRRV